MPLSLSKPSLTPQPENLSGRILRNTFFLSAGELLARVSTLGVTIFLTRTWKDVGLYGQYALVVNWVAVFAVIGELGLNALTVREVAHHREKANFYLRNVMFFRTLLSMVFWIAMLGAAFVLGYETVLKVGMAVMGLRLILDSFSGGYIYLLQAHQEMGTYSKVNILSAAVRFFGIIGIVAAGASLVGASWVWVAASAVSLCVFVSIGRKRGWTPRFREFRWEGSLTVLKQAVPLATFGTLQILYYRVDAVILKSLSGNGPSRRMPPPSDAWLSGGSRHCSCWVFP
jgi:O-antigen/teichoic acid export membrane protein